MNVSRIIDERFCCNRPGLTQRDERDWREKRDMQGQGSHLALVARHSAISRRTVMEMQVRGEHDWFFSTGLEEKSKKILPVVGRRRETYNIWGVER